LYGVGRWAQCRSDIVFETNTEVERQWGVVVEMEDSRSVADVEASAWRIPWFNFGPLVGFLISIRY
jgi:hypothetical protein